MRKRGPQDWLSIMFGTLAEPPILISHSRQHSLRLTSTLQADVKLGQALGARGCSIYRKATGFTPTGNINLRGYNLKGIFNST